MKKIVIPISGVDDSMIGFCFGAWEIIAINAPEDTNSNSVFGLDEKTVFRAIYHLLESEDAYIRSSFFVMEPRIHILALTIEVENTEDPFFDWYVLSTIDALRLFKNSQFRCFAPIEFSNNTAHLISKYDGFQGEPFENQRPLLSITPGAEKDAFMTFLDKTIRHKYDSIVTQMVMFFHESCRTKNQYLRFVLRITIMEMLIEGPGELTYRLTHYLSVMLGRSRAESCDIAAKFKKMYQARSSYLHNGDESKISKDYSELAFEYARRLIANLIMITDGIKEIRNKLESAGYGSNPYQILF